MRSAQFWEFLRSSNATGLAPSQINQLDFSINARHYECICGAERLRLAHTWTVRGIRYTVSCLEHYTLQNPARLKFSEATTSRRG